MPINEMLEELEAAIRLVQSNIERIRAEYGEPEEEGPPEYETRAARREGQMQRNRARRASRDFGDFNDLNM